MMKQEIDWIRPAQKELYKELGQLIAKLEKIRRESKSEK